MVNVSDLGSISMYFYKVFVNVYIDESYMYLYRNR